MRKNLLTVIFLLIFSLPIFSQTQMMIYKTDGSVDSVQLTQIKNITFSTTSGVIPTQGIVAYYPFDGNAADSSGNGYNGTIFYATPTQNRFGVDSNAYSFDGQSKAIELGNVLNNVFCDSIAKFSISGWALVRSGGSVSSVLIAKSGGGTDGPYQWSISYYYGNINAGVCSDTLAKNYIALESPVSLNQWFHFALTFDGSLPELQRVKLYINGSAASTSLYQHIGTLGTSTTASQQNIQLGASHPPNISSWNNFLNGNLDDIRIYNRALSNTEILNLYISNN